jgi:hypothetical protein
LTGGRLANTNALVPGPHLSTPSSTQRSRTRAKRALAAFGLCALQHAACLPLDDLSSYSSAWERQSAVTDDGRLDASTDVDDPEDGGAVADDAGARLDASSPLGTAPDAGDGARAPDAGERPTISDGGPALDAGELDAALTP